MRWGQWVVGPPGSGKTTYCYAMKQLCKAMDRSVCIVNLDPANDTEIHRNVEDDKKHQEVDLKNIFDIDIRKLIAIEDVMEEFSLGPNGALLYAMEFIFENLSWLQEQLDAYSEKHDCRYFIFDCPGQVELYSVESHGGMRNILKAMTNHRALTPYRLTAVHLVDSSLVKDLSSFVSSLFVSLSCQVMLELPFVNLLSKVDLLSTVKDNLVLPLRDYVQVNGLQELVELEARKTPKSAGLWAKKRWRFVSEMLEEVEDTNLTDFDLIDIHSQNSMASVIGRIDRANGLALSGALGAEFCSPEVTYQIDKVQLSTPLNPLQQSQLFDEIVERHLVMNEDAALKQTDQS